MANVLTNLIPDTYAALDVVANEKHGLLASIYFNTKANDAAKGEKVRVPVTQANTAVADIVPAMGLPSRADQTIKHVDIEINKFRKAPFSWTAEEAYAMSRGPGFLTIRQDQIAQAMRALLKEMASDVYKAAYLASSAIHGTAGTPPVFTDNGAPADMKKLLDDAGAPESERKLILNTAAGAAIRKTSNYVYADRAGTDRTLRQGTILETCGFDVNEEWAIQSVAGGNASGYLINNTGGYPAGATDLNIDTGTGTFNDGDLVTINSNLYQVASSTATSITLVSGLVGAVADNATVVVAAGSVRNLAFTRQSIVLAHRAPARVENDLALFKETIRHPGTGLTFELVAWPGSDMVTYEVRACWGVAAIKPEFIKTLLG